MPPRFYSIWESTAFYSMPPHPCRRETTRRGPAFTFRFVVCLFAASFALLFVFCSKTCHCFARPRSSSVTCSTATRAQVPPTPRVALSCQERGKVSPCRGTYREGSFPFAKRTGREGFLVWHLQGRGGAPLLAVFKGFSRLGPILTVKPRIPRRAAAECSTARCLLPVDRMSTGEMGRHRWALRRKEAVGGGRAPQALSAVLCPPCPVAIVSSSCPRGCPRVLVSSCPRGCPRACGLWPVVVVVPPCPPRARCASLPTATLLVLLLIFPGGTAVAAAGLFQGHPQVRACPQSRNYER